MSKIEWNKHDGRECPVHPDAIVEVRSIEGNTLAARAGSLQWRAAAVEQEGRIAAFRVFQRAELKAEQIATLRAGGMNDTTRAAV